MSDLFSILNQKVQKGECTWQEILSAIEAIKSENTDFDYFVIRRSIKEVDMLHSESNPYRICLRRQLYEKLSNDAKQTAGLIVSIMNGHFRYSSLENDLIHKEKVTKRRAYSVIRKQFRWSMKKIAKIFDELRNYCNELEKLE